MKPKTPFTVFFESFPEMDERIQKAFLHIERNAIQSAYYLGKLQSESGKTEEEFFNNFYENN